MNRNKHISVVIIDDDKDAIFALRSYLELIPDIEIKGTATHYQKAVNLIKDQSPDLVFLDVEMPGKTGFELIEDFERNGERRNFSVIFHTAYDKYTIRALRESAFDFLLKPAKEEELKGAIQRFREQRNKPVPLEKNISNANHKEMVAIPTNTGLQFVPKSDIVYFEIQKSGMGLRSVWTVVMNNQQTLKLRHNTKANAIIHYLGDDSFIQISQGAIVSISFINIIEYKTYECFLFPPFDQKSLKISRQFMSELRDRFDVI
ncbi:MAG: LytR/AlgR family response regulator transcription factor [Bacteroidales bacterium]